MCHVMLLTKCLHALGGLRDLVHAVDVEFQPVPLRRAEVRLQQQPFVQVPWQTLPYDANIDNY